MINCDRDDIERFVSNASGRAVNFECGCFVAFAMSVETGTIGRIRLSTNGCGFMIAAAKALAEAHSQFKLAELGGSSGGVLLNSITAKIGDVLDERHGCCMAAVAAFQNALINHREHIMSEFQGDSPLVCTCFGVTEETITSLIEVNRLSEVADVTRICRAGGGCGSCTLLIQEYVDLQASAALL